MKLKQHPLDFTVEEITSIIPTPDHDIHQVFLLEKQEMDTFEALRFLSKKWLVPYHEIGYAGLKDKHAVTKQWISIPSCYEVRPFQKERIKTNFMGYCSEKIRIGELIGNRFSIVVRDITEDQIPTALGRCTEVAQSGVLNYFDSQRFGSVIKNQFIAKAILQKDVETAVKWFLTLYQKSEPLGIKNDKRKILANWHDLQSIQIQDRRLQKVVDTYLSSNNWLAAYQSISMRLRELFKNAYQSYLWNEAIKTIASEKIDTSHLFSVPYAAGSLFLYRTISDIDKEGLPTEFPTISGSVDLTAVEQSIISKVLKKEQLKLEDFTRFDETGTYFSTQYRPVLVVPKNFANSGFEKDEVNSTYRNNRFKIRLTYEMPKGSYATMVTKSIFGH